MRPRGTRRRRPSPRQTCLATAVAFAVLSPILQAIAQVGLSPAALASAGDTTLRAAGYAFAIWSAIYAGLVAFAVYQALPRRRADPLLEIIAVPALVAIVGIGCWIWASALDARWASVAIIVVSASVLTAGLLRAARQGPAPRGVDRIFVWWPLSVLAAGSPWPAR